MCQTHKTTHPCSHNEEHTVPSPTINDPSAIYPPLPPLKTSSPHPCPSCAEDVNYLPAIIRAHYLLCTHYHLQVLQPFSLPGSARFIDDVHPGRCPWCLWAPDGMIENMKRHGVRSEDPWGELGRMMTQEESSALGKGARGMSRNPFETGRGRGVWARYEVPVASSSGTGRAAARTVGAGEWEGNSCEEEPRRWRTGRHILDEEIDMSAWKGKGKAEAVRTPVGSWNEEGGTSAVENEGRVPPYGTGHEFAPTEGQESAAHERHVTVGAIMAELRAGMDFSDDDDKDEPPRGRSRNPRTLTYDQPHRDTSSCYSSQEQGRPRPDKEGYVEDSEDDGPPVPDRSVPAAGEAENKLR